MPENVTPSALLPVGPGTEETIGDLGQIALTPEERAAQQRLAGEAGAGLRQVDLDPSTRNALDGAKAEGEYYTTGAQKVRALAEGFISGVTLGGADLLEEALDGDQVGKRKRGEYNPGYRAGGELLGGLVLPVGNVKGVVSGIKAGALQGAGQGLTAAVLAEDPLTIEAAASSIGHGALLGGAVGGALGGVGKAIERAGIRAEAHAADRAIQSLDDEGTRLTQLLGSRDAPVLYTRAVQSADDAVSRLRGLDAELPLPPKPPGGIGALSQVEARNVYRGLRTSGDDLMGRAALSNPEALKVAGKEVSAVRKAWKDLETLAKAEAYDGQAAFKSARTYRDAVDNLAAKLGEAPNVHPDIAAVMGRATQANEEATKIFEKAVADRGKQIADAADLADRLASFPKSAEELARMTPDEVGALGVTMNRAAKHGAATSVGSAFDEFISLGMKMSPEGLRKMTAAEIAMTAGFSGPAVKALGALEGTPAARVVKAWAVLKNLESAALPKAGRVAESGARGGLRESLFTAAGGSLGARIGMSAGHVGAVAGGTLGAVAGKTIARLTAPEMAATVGAARARIGRAVASWGKRLGRAYQKSARTGAATLTHFTLNQPPKRGESPSDAFYRIRDDLTGSMPVLRDRAFVASQPYREMDIKLGDQMFEHLVNTITHLHATMPKDPGGPGRLGKSRWEPSRQELAAWGRRLAVVQDPASAMERLTSLTLEEADTLRVVAPAFFAEVKQRVLDDLPRLQETLDREEILSLSLLLDEPLDDVLTPEYLRRAQATHKVAAEQAASPDAQTPYHTPGKLPELTEAQNVTYR